MEDYVRDFQLINAEVLKNEKSVTERAEYRVTYKIKILFQTVLIFQNIEMEGTLRIQVIHVTGMRIIAQGNDGLSRGIMK